MAFAFWRCGAAAPIYAYDALLPDDARLLVSDHGGIGERSTTRLRFLRPITNGNGYQHCAPCAEVSFTTDADYFRLNLYWNALVTRLDTFNSLGSIFIDGVEAGTFSCPHAADVAGSSAPFFALPAGSHIVRIVWPYGAGLDLASIDVQAGASVSLPTRPANKLAVCGDSITHGYSVGRAALTWAFKLAALDGRQVVNLANGSEAASAANGNALVGITGIDKILYFIGFNNFYPQTNVAAFQTAVEGWIANARAAQPSAAIYVGMHRTLKTAADYGGVIEPAIYRAAVQAAEAAAGDANTFYIDGHALVSADAANFVDEIHYSDAGAAAAATALDAII